MVTNDPMIIGRAGAEKIATHVSRFFKDDNRLRRDEVDATRCIKLFEEAMLAPAISDPSPGGQLSFKIGPQHGKGEALKEFVQMAREGKLDPTIGRDEVLTGPPGVGKTAILGGLASKIISQESLHNKRVLSIDLSALLAGSGIRGQFEEKLRSLLQNIEGRYQKADNVICFIDEGSIDGGQMIKPALARGLQLVGATTPDKYRKTIGKDAALERRFQPPHIEEPTVESTISILRGLKPRYEVHHGVEISDSALESKPDELEMIDRAIMTLQIELESLKKESDVFSVERRDKAKADLAAKREEASQLSTMWQAASCLRFSSFPDLEKQLPDENDRNKDENSESPLAMLHDRVTSNDIARVMEDTLRRRVVGQDYVVAPVSDAVRISRAGLQALNRPVALVLLGPTDVSRLIGAAPGYVGFEEGGKCHAVILLDELEKAHKVSGSNILAHPAASTEGGVVTPDARQQVLDLTCESFPPELLNSLDTMLVFNKLSRESILQVVSLRLHDVAERLSGRRITLDAQFSDGDTVEVRVSPDTNAFVIQENHPPDPQLGSADLQNSLDQEEE
ncbi:P-loop containing nucleoside triphosphate hydrolase protein [Mycena rosella]|uniref:P-loop containing nucleoside triphosphate hydrolase protein n=1 Tax=Mycena rosella TaxID=1033263 RepID=A0AAD7H3L2_MYCRO|nr:P-loop containing nucleoside triphosphate hydrolase protein [Mycena rosella]